jgi:hypothetical protein
MRCVRPPLKLYSTAAPAAVGVCRHTPSVQYLVPGHTAVLYSLKFLWTRCCRNFFGLDVVELLIALCKAIRLVKVRLVKDRSERDRICTATKNY